MKVNKGIVALVIGAAATVSTAFAQEGLYKQDATVQALGSFVKQTNENGIPQTATNSGGVLSTYRYFFNRNNGVEINYGYTLNTQIYGTGGSLGSIKAFSHEATAAYVWRLPLGKVTPFALAGVGGLVFNASDTPSLDAQARPAFVYGAGADWHFSNRFFLRTQYRGLVYNNPTFELSSVGSERLTHRAEPSAGFGFRF